MSPTNVDEPCGSIQLSACRMSRLRAEGEVGGLRLARADGDVHLLRAELLVPGFDRVRARRQTRDLERSGRVAHREERMREHTDVRGHPAMHVALKRNHHLFGAEGALGFHALARLADVEATILRRNG